MAGKITTAVLQEMTARGEKIAMLTAYDYLTAEIIDKVGVDVILVGDTLAMVVAGHETTLPITLENMLYHTEIVARATKRALVVGDLPFMSYQVSPEQALVSAGRMMKEGRAHAVKLEGGRRMVPTIKRIVGAGIPIMGHIGLTPQSVFKFGGYKLQGGTANEAQRILESAKALENAGCFALVLEKIPQGLAARVSEALTIPTIGIGAGPHCDGQVLVLHDMLGIFEKFHPKFVKVYANLGPLMRDAFSRYVADVKQGVFPAPEHSYD
ncbi:MAG: 3-methyl-2-oxobutanoate hydroxymethyltransferase [Acidobacteria bacterium]|nr:3-methyl-2-oxobutanoate hydroxymethyltransferase [Acidobacteriota bacterium]MBI3657540.1 3-methyl-2-oxobutanoate hydroxymethyltransferase [Acidobacteriota bacterium]